jgi:hypothetical protein
MDISISFYRVKQYNIILNNYFKLVNKMIILKKCKMIFYPSKMSNIAKYCKEGG